MPGGTLLAYDDIFPRATAGNLTVLNRPSIDELQRNSYPEPHQLLAINSSHRANEYIASISHGMQQMRGVDCLILFGHGRVAQVAQPTGVVQVTVGIVLGSEDITSQNAHLLRQLRHRFLRNAHCELWVCDAANAAAVRGAPSGAQLCQAIADALTVRVTAAEETQSFETENQVITSNTAESTAVFLPWEGRVTQFQPHRRSR